MPGKLPIEETYGGLEKYLLKNNYESAFTIINEKTDFDKIGECIDKAIEDEKQKATLSSPAPSVVELNKQLDNIVYLSALSYFYLKNSKRAFVPYAKITTSPSISTKRLNAIKLYSEKRHQTFKKLLEMALSEKSIAKDEPLLKVVKTYIAYLQTVNNANVSKLAEYAGRWIDNVDFTKIKKEAGESSEQLSNLLEQYEIRYQGTINFIASDSLNTIKATPTSNNNFDSDYYYSRDEGECEYFSDSSDDDECEGECEYFSDSSDDDECEGKCEYFSDSSDDEEEDCMSSATNVEADGLKTQSGVYAQALTPSSLNQLSQNAVSSDPITESDSSNEKKPISRFKNWLKSISWINNLIQFFNKQEKNLASSPEINIKNNSEQATHLAPNIKTEISPSSSRPTSKRLHQNPAQGSTTNRSSFFKKVENKILSQKLINNNNRWRQHIPCLRI